MPIISVTYTKAFDPLLYDFNDNSFTFKVKTAVSAMKMMLKGNKTISSTNMTNTATGQTYTIILKLS